MSIEAEVTAAVVPRLKKRRFNPGEWLIERVISAGGMLTIVIVLLIFAFLLLDSWPTFRSVPLNKLLLGRGWYPLSDPPEFGFMPLILGSLLVTLGAVVIALPIGVAAAVYIGEIASPRVREVLKPTVEVLASIPSIVVGFLGLVLLAPWIKQILGLGTGLTAMTGSIMLAFMAMPTIISISEDALHAVPRDYRSGSLALGATQWQTISRVVVPAARSGILAAIMLGVGRAIGETMVVLMVTGNAAVIPSWEGGKFILQPVRTITATIAGEMGEVVHQSPHYHTLFALGLVLFAVTFAINLVADMALQRGRR